MPLRDLVDRLRATEPQDMANTRQVDPRIAQRYHFVEQRGVARLTAFSVEEQSRQHHPAMRGDSSFRAVQHVACMVPPSRLGQTLKPAQPQRRRCRK